MTSIPPALRVVIGRLAPAAASVATLLTVAGCADPPGSETLRFAHGASDVEVVFHGEVADDDVFGPRGSLLDHVHPRDEKGRPRGQVFNARPGWLHFEYRIDGQRREVLVARQPLLHHVSWHDVARAGAALADDAPAADVAAATPVQGASVADARGRRYRVRLPTCGRSTLSDLSEWNLLVGAVHRGDQDFAGPHYGWVRRPYDDAGLKVGYHGSLSWCQEHWQAGERVARGYFFVSRLHASAPDLRTDRLHWRPVLELVAPAAAPPDLAGGEAAATVRWSPSRRVGFAGTLTNAELFGRAESIAGRVDVEGGQFVGDGQPSWLHFVVDGRRLLVAARPIKFGVSWDAIAQAGAALGDGSTVRIGWRGHRQDAEVQGADGKRYRVRLLGCGRSTLDLGSEWNQLIGGVHRGDGDFVAHPRGVYGWLTPPLDDAGVHVGLADGSATWCRDRIEVDGRLHGVNRGYMTVSRFHATETAFTGVGFGWRPVLEEVR